MAVGVPPGGGGSPPLHPLEPGSNEPCPCCRGQQSGERKSWLWGYRQVEGAPLHPLGFALQVDHVSTDVSQWEVTRVVYNGQMFYEMEDLMDRYNVRAARKPQSQGWVARQRPSRFTANGAESPPVSCNSAQVHCRPRLGDNFCHANPHFGIVTVFLSAVVATWHPTGTTLAEGRSGMLACNPAQVSDFGLSLI